MLLKSFLVALLSIRASVYAQNAVQSKVGQTVGVALVPA